MDHQELLARGFFPESLPLAFTSVDFAQVSPSLQYADSRGLRDKWTRPAQVNVARPNGLRRRMAIVNPFKHRLLAKELETNWSGIESHLRQSEISISRPVPVTVTSPAERATRYLGYSLPRGGRAGARSATLGGTRYTLITDVSNFYGSIYTHAIDWALTGKANAKAAAGAVNTLGSTLDQLVRNGQHGQTQGIPVGPDSSSAIAEIVMAPIDQALCRLHPRVRTRARRFVDDLEFGARSYTEAEEVMHAWESELAKFELTVNPLKTRIVDGALPPEPSWKIALRQHPIREDSPLKLANDLRSLFSIAFETTHNAPDAAAVAYVVRRAAELQTSGVAWEELQDLLMGAMTVEPSSMRRVYEVIARAVWGGREPESDRFEEVLNDICVHHAAREHGSEVTWALYLIFRLGLFLESETACAVLGMQDNCSLILLRSLEASGHVRGSSLDWGPVISRVEDMTCPHSEDWLLGYEFARNGWASPRAFRALPYWQELIGLGVAFFEAPAALIPGHVGAAGRSRPSAVAPARGDSAYSASRNESEDREAGESRSECEDREEVKSRSDTTTDRRLSDSSATASGDGEGAPYASVEVTTGAGTNGEEAADDNAGHQADDEDPDLDLVELMSFGMADAY